MVSWWFDGLKSQLPLSECLTREGLHPWNATLLYGGFLSHRGTPKSSVLLGFSRINHRFLGTWPSDWWFCGCPSYQEIKRSSMVVGGFGVVPSGNFFQFAIKNCHLQLIYPSNMVIYPSNVVIHPSKMVIYPFKMVMFHSYDSLPEPILLHPDLNQGINRSSSELGVPPWLWKPPTPAGELTSVHHSRAFCSPTNRPTGGSTFSMNYISLLYPMTDPCMVKKC